MSRKLRPLPPVELQIRNPEGYARAVDRHLARLERQAALDLRRVDRKRAAPMPAAPARRRLVVPSVWRMPSLEGRGYFRTRDGLWRYLPRGAR